MRPLLRGICRTASNMTTKPVVRELYRTATNGSGLVLGGSALVATSAVLYSLSQGGASGDVHRRKSTSTTSASGGGAGGESEGGGGGGESPVWVFEETNDGAAPTAKAATIHVTGTEAESGEEKEASFGLNDQPPQTKAKKEKAVSFGVPDDDAQSAGGARGVTKPSGAPSPGPKTAPSMAGI
mmetsp:Transcript_24712/g.57094  ORF Transcript_24712/g.57094 Transcript_24712/m.57094 type:complete len:183 (-) Transcript_24712:398-946(-)